MTAAAQLTESSSPSSLDEFSFLVLPPGYADGNLRERIAKHLEAPIAMTKGKMTIEKLFDQYDAGLAQIWVGAVGSETCGCVTTEILKYETGPKVLRVMLCGGDLGTLVFATKTSIEAIEKFAVAEGCSSVLIEGRKGWGKFLTGYKENWIVLEKELV